ncbi:acyl-CoA dehydrogenase [Ramlibacter henchirensis]|uniref:Acyl-CoA dehydrogenase n=1 Tax=Ramlibacter henchirensis TaxID=204072 RepID=A0A4Z0BUC2_9BURK|nr:acyl-CoA dehydrogenase family protein [Ramlibacter henchirensis]TFZ02896.1 acyl-CoA dehydrogenase [Ramlibacter henchirensis]
MKSEIATDTTDELEAFRRTTREWLEANCPSEMRRPATSEADICWGGRRFTFQSEAQKQWMQRMAERGWTVPTWPREYGGGGLTRDEAVVLQQEMAALGCRPPLQNNGTWMFGAALLKYGSEAHKREHLPLIARGEIRWAQGYSEPGAGSDLASLSTRADVHDDHFVVNGQKVWTSFADQCDMIFCLVRTDAAQKHTGISFLLIDMNTPGVRTRPIRLISGKSPFCETFFDDVRVPRANLVGDLNAGWTIAKYLLTHEREMVSSIYERRAPPPLGRFAVERVGRDALNRLDAPALRTAIARFEVDEAAFRAWLAMFGAQSDIGEANPAVPSALKYYGSELAKRRNDLMMAAGGSDALEWESDRSEQGVLARTWLHSRKASIEGGTSEIMLNMIAKRLLGLSGT